MVGDMCMYSWHGSGSNYTYGSGSNYTYGGSGSNYTYGGSGSNYTYGSGSGSGSSSSGVGGPLDVCLDATGAPTDLFQLGNGECGFAPLGCAPGYVQQQGKVLGF